MSRVIVLNDVINFEPEKKNFNSRNAHVHISAPASYCFQLLIEKQGELVTHEEFYQYAWRQFGMEATANTLYQNISLIRRGLETCGLHEDIIRTMPRRGFILSPAVKIQYTRTRDLMEQQAVVESFGDKPIPEKTKPEMLAEKLSEPDQTAKLDVDSPLKKKTEPESFKKVPDQKHFFEHLQVEPFRHIACGRALLHIWYYIAVAGAVISSIYLVFFLSFSPYLISLNFDYLTTYNQCEYYIDRNGEDSKKAMDLIVKIKKSCPQGKYNYLTKYTDSGMVSLINCREPMSFLHSINCNSEYITGMDDD